MVLGLLQYRNAVLLAVTHTTCDHVKQTGKCQRVRRQNSTAQTYSLQYTVESSRKSSENNFTLACRRVVSDAGNAWLHCKYGMKIEQAKFKIEFPHNGCVSMCFHSTLSRLLNSGRQIFFRTLVSLAVTRTKYDHVKQTVLNNVSAFDNRIPLRRMCFRYCISFIKKPWPWGF